MLMIALLLNSFMNLQAQNKGNDFSTGSELYADSAFANVPVYLIKQANAKMIERLYLIDINNQQDSIINMKDNDINEQHNISSDFQKKLDNANKINKNMVKTLDKQKKRNRIIAYCGGISIIGLIINLIVK